MAAWIVVSIAAVAAAATVIAALLLEERPEAEGASGDGATARLLPDPPSPDDVRSVAFPLARDGYDPTTVDRLLKELLDAYERLWRQSGHSRDQSRRAGHGHRAGQGDRLWRSSWERDDDQSARDAE